MAHVSSRIWHEPLEQANTETDQALALGEHVLCLLLRCLFPAPKGQL
jgi:hypothetical protein